jgi:2-oxoglutarate dehydrogenase E2 component (dihydrolipoamide succinyltransferase)
MIEIKVPTVGESINEVTLVKWLKPEGAWVERDELLCELESEKATFELNAEQAGILHIVAAENATLNIGDLACKIDETASRPANAAPAAEEKPAKAAIKEEKKEVAPTPVLNKDVKATPVANAIMADKQVKATDVVGSGSLGKIKKQDVLDALANPGKKVGAAAFSRNDRPENGYVDHL